MDFTTGWIEDEHEPFLKILLKFFNPTCIFVYNHLILLYYRNRFNFYKKYIEA